MPNPSDFPPFNAQGEPLGGVSCGLPWYRPRPQPSVCVECGEPLGDQRGVRLETVDGEVVGGRYGHHDCLAFARSKRHGRRRVVPLMAVGQSYDAWQDIEKEQRDQRAASAESTRDRSASTSAGVAAGGIPVAPVRTAGTPEDA